MQKQNWTVVAVGTDTGRSVIFLTRPHHSGSGVEQMTVPTDLKTMSKMAADGVPVRNV